VELYAAVRRDVLNSLPTMLAQATALATADFDATITLKDQHLAAAGLTGRKAEAVEAVREAVERMDGAHWMGVDAQSYPPVLPGWVIVYPRGWCVTPDTPEYRELREGVEFRDAGDLAARGSMRRGHLGHWVTRPPEISTMLPLT